MSAFSERKTQWFRFHLTSALVMVVTSAALLHVNLSPGNDPRWMPGIGHGPTSLDKVIVKGWPYSFCCDAVWHPSELLFDGFFALIVVLLAGFVVESFIRLTIKATN